VTACLLAPLWRHLGAGLKRPAAWVAFALVLLAGPALAATYTFRSDSFAWETAANAITWNRTCTAYPGDDDQATVTFTGGFTFSFGGVAYGSVRVLTNGSLQFGADTGFHAHLHQHQPARRNCRRAHRAVPLQRPLAR
jgi:hypothetical protein